MDVSESHIGRRIREVRTWRGLSQTTAAELAGITGPYLSMIERGVRPVTKRAVLEGIAQALRVSPAELTGKPYAPSDAVSAVAHAAMAAVSDALSGWSVGEFPEVPDRPWQAVQADVARLNSNLRPNADYSAQAELLPDLIAQLLSAVGTEHRTDALVGLLSAYKAAAYLAHDLGVAGLPMLAVERMRQVAEQLDDPVWLAYAAYQRAQLLTGANRTRQHQLAVAVAEAPGARVETKGLAHLTAALACAARSQPDEALAHVAEAAALAESIEPDVSPWMQTNFGRTNVGIWRVTIGTELGEGARVAELASGFTPGGVSKSRQAAFWIDYGRGLLAERKFQEQGLVALLRAEKLAPQKVRNNVFVREAVGSLLSSARQSAGSRELRGLAWRVGIGPNG
ncbi:helix-turn-helix domain-containing protein [Actinokineospora iranica]|uniref:Transcriptional regulator, contains XRE-family HTH domain n=1 Tax=Actinokineospora iranica TaxID=1271860 RepID=A0A1G6LRK4_9PSEU|nr:helix-turn-helix transcriptional regulator [Actinokineospora iranica]SDC45395.1 Transcriptional regulator, contains XRE-family HTH domain [Actinokineospora iranica]